AAVDAAFRVDLFKIGLLRPADDAEAGCRAAIGQRLPDADFVLGVVADSRGASQQCECDRQYRSRQPHCFRPSVFVVDAGRRANQARARFRKSPLASLNSAFSRATSSATGGASAIWPMPWPEPQMSRHALALVFPPEPKFIFDLSLSGRLSGSSPAAMIEGPR